MSTITPSVRGEPQILVFCLSHAWGGLEQVAILDALDAAKSLFVGFVFFNQSKVHQRLYELAKAKGCKVEMIALVHEPARVFDFTLRAVLKKFIGNKRTVIHLHQQHLLPSIVPWLGGFSRDQVKLVVSRHIWNDHNKKNFFHRWLLSRVDRLVVMSEALRIQMLKTVSIAPEKLEVLHLGLNFDLFNPDPVVLRGLRSQQREKWAQKCSIGPNTLCVGLVARLDPKKGQDLFLTVAKAFLKKRGWAQDQIQFFLIGAVTHDAPLETAEYVQNLKKYVLDQHLEGFVHLTGFVSNIPAVMAALDVLMFPSVTEAFGLVAIEAMIMGCSVILSQASSGPEIANHGRCAWLAQGHQSDSFLECLEQIVDHPERVQAKRKEAQEWVLRNYDQKKRAEGTLFLYETLFGEQK
jgi:glycosyltransferase involved in cell wall biosynthesis